MTTAGRRPPPGRHQPCRSGCCPARTGRLYHGTCRQTGPVRSGGVLDRGRHGDGARHVVGRDRDLFCVPRRRSHPADRAPGGNAIRLRRPHRGTARESGPHHQPPIAGSGTIRPETRPGHASPDHAGIARRGAWRHSGFAGHRIDQAAIARSRDHRCRSFGYAETLADQRYRHFRGAAGPRSPPGIAGARDRQSAAE